MIDACILWDDETAYFFRGEDYWRWDVGPDEISEGYPMPIAEGWPGWPEHWVDVEAAVMWPTGHVYFFREDEYLLFDTHQETVLPGYPKRIHDNWRGFPHHWTGVDAALVWPNGRAYFFREGEYIAYDIDADAVLPGYPRRIHGNWQNWPSDWGGCTSAIMWPDGSAYFMNENDCITFDIESDMVLPGSMETVGEAWPGLPED
jgi:hypothetical protein